MPTTIVGPGSATMPRALYAPLVYIKPSWGGSWQYRPDLEMVSASRCSASQGIDECHVVRRYGYLKQPYETGKSTKTALSIDKWWVRLRVITNNGIQTIWMGQISSEVRDVFGSDVAKTGRQGWVAYGPIQILRKSPISRSHWEESGSVLDIGWVPSLNTRDRHNALVGNRSADMLGGAYLYGGTSIWNHHQAVEYILAKFASVDGGPQWTLGGQAALLEDIRDAVEMMPTQSVAQALRRLIPRELGIDYKIEATSGGFEVHVFALVGEDVSFEGASLPRNPNPVRVRSGEMHDMPHVKVVRTPDHTYGKIRILGRRILLCTSLKGPKKKDSTQPLGWSAVEDASLVPKWSDELKAEYDAGSSVGGAVAEEHDRARTADKFRPVYQFFGAPEDWGKAAPILKANGEVEGGEQDYQKKVRETLHYLPLFEGYDYSEGKEENKNPEGYQPDLMEPLVWFYDEDAHDLQLAGTFYLQAQTLGIGVMGAYEDWGLQLSVSPNHLIAHMHFDYPGTPAQTEIFPKFDYDFCLATIAFRADQRLEIVYDVPGGDETVKDIFVPSAELWLLLPETAVGLSEIGEIQTSGSELRTLRNDAQYLHFIMAGAIARYARPRARADITLKGLQAWGGLIGHILTVVEEAGNTESIQAPITSVRWTSGNDPQTFIGAGHAR